MAFIEIKVTEQDIVRSTKNDAGALWIKHCPIAVASKRSIPNFDHVSQKHLVISVADGIGYYKTELPKIAKDFTVAADTQRSVRAGLTKADEYDVDQEPLKPISFSVYIPDKYDTRQGTIDDQNNRNQG